MRKVKKKRIIRRGKKRNWNKTDCISVFNNCKKKKTGKIGRRGNFNDPFLSFLFFLFFPNWKRTKTDVESRRKKSDFSEICGEQLGREQQDQQDWEDFPSQFLSCLKNFRPKRKTSVLEREKWGRGWRRKESCLTYRLITHGLHKPDKVTTNICLLAFFLFEHCSPPFLLFFLYPVSILSQLRFSP